MTSSSLVPVMTSAQSAIGIANAIATAIAKIVAAFGGISIVVVVPCNSKYPMFAIIDCPE
jgi:hypothetical protein